MNKQHRIFVSLRKNILELLVINFITNYYYYAEQIHLHSRKSKVYQILMLVAHKLLLK
jgi:hypothetical protein